MTPQIDIIIPVYNEAATLRSLVERIAVTLNQKKITFHIYGVDDHSTDDSWSILQKLAQQFPLTPIKKMGKQGKAYSIFEGVAAGKAPFCAMIDADLQYPPEALVDMLAIAPQHGVVIANRKIYQGSWLRRLASRSFRWSFGQVLHGLKCDVQSGLKIFRRDIVNQLNPDLITAWTIDLPLLLTAQGLGYTIGQVDITYGHRLHGNSHISLHAFRQIGGHALAYKLRQPHTFHLTPESKTGMLGAGVVHQKRRYITHTTLNHNLSAIRVTTTKQRLLIYFILAFLGGLLIINALLTAKLVIGFLSLIYFIDVFFNLFLIVKSLHQPPEISVLPTELAQLKDISLPTYTILCPLYKEFGVLPQFLANIDRLDWPKNKLDVILLLEADDVETLSGIAQMHLPSYVRAMVVPDSQPKTKPKACNYGLHFAKGEYLVIFDAEDKPDRDQLKKVYLAFKKVPDDVKCIQAKLNFYNPHQNLLTRFFTAEYSLWFDVVLTGLQSIETTIPLGGTSNHFRTAELQAMEGWDPFNVTEDCDLGVRLFNRGHKTAIIDSMTLEEANSDWGNWLRQRSRWIKGYMQTYLVHMRSPRKFYREQGKHALIFQLVVGGKIAFMLINPLMWLLTITYFGLYAWVGPTIESFYPPIIFYMAVTSLVFGNFMFIYYYMIGAAKREHWSVIKWVYLVPFYWLLVSMAAGMALYQLIVKPHYWEKTRHGLNQKPVLAQAIAMPQVAGKIEKKPSPLIHYLTELTKKPLFKGGILLVLANLGASVLNMVTAFYLGKSLSFADFGLFNVFMSIFFLTNIPISAVGSTINYKASYLMGKHKLDSLGRFIQQTQNRIFLYFLPIALIWILIMPWIKSAYHLPSVLMLLIFLVIWLVSINLTINSSYLSARLVFGQLALLVIIQPIMRLASAVLLTKLIPAWAFVAILIGISAPAFLATRLTKTAITPHAPTHEYYLPKTYFLAALLSGLSTVAFFSLDNLVIAHFLSSTETGQYAFMGLFGKLVFFTGTLFLTFMAPLVARKEGGGEHSQHLFRQILLGVSVMTAIGYLVFIIGTLIFGHQFVGEKLLDVQIYLPLYGFGVACFTLSQVVVGYYLVKKQYLFPITAFALSIIQVIGLWLFHRDLSEVTMIMASVGVIQLVTLSVLHKVYPKIVVPLANIQDFFGLFQKWSKKDPVKKRNTPSILILNWRDTKHVWAGGAETYLHQVAKRLVTQGYNVTVFCGNDGNCLRNETIENVQIVRRGGFYTVYFWAAIYYLLKFRSNFDLIIDSENGIPFMTPLYARKPIFLLVHHVHQEVFRSHLRFPLSTLAGWIESTLMPLAYAYKQIITVSQSSRNDIVSLGLGSVNSIEILHPGVEENLFYPNAKAKTSYPSFVYVGRLKPYKNVDVAIRAFSLLTKKWPTAKFTIAGNGESLATLKQLAVNLKLSKNIDFITNLSDLQKAKLFAQSWIALQPSMIEGWGITVIEANAAGTPVIASNVKGLRDSIQHNKTGVLVAAMDVNDFYLAMLTLTENKTLRQKLSRSAVTWSQQFSWQRSTEILIKNINQALLGQPSTTSPESLISPVGATS